MDVSIIIVHYNTPELTTNCIESVYKQTKNVAFEVIVVDNASTVHDASELKVKFPGIVLIKSNVNLGFAGGNNLGIERATGKYILLLNSDTVLKENAVLTTYNYLEQRPRVGAVSARLIFPDGRHQSVCQRFPSIRYSAIELFRLQKFFSKQKAGRLLLGSFFDNTENVSVDWVWGAFFMFPKELLSGLPEQKLDDTYFMYCEDMQWCWDIKKLGYEVHFCADAEVIHIMGGSNAKKEHQMLKNMESFKRKNYNKVHLALINILEKLLFFSR